MSGPARIYRTHVKRASKDSLKKIPSNDCTTIRKGTNR